MDIKINNRYLQALKRGSLSLQGEFVWGSNHTFLLQVEDEDISIRAVYKPTKGERPLWDFPEATLTKRETAAYLVSEALGWQLVPATVFRKDAMYGPGSLQLYIDHDPEYHYFSFTDEDRQKLRPVVLFDLICNNADRKGSHILFDQDHHLWAIDHGICFHVEDKLRTVIWDFAGQPIDENLINDLVNFVAKLGNHAEDPTDTYRSVRRYLDSDEITAMVNRTQKLIEQKVYPSPGEDRRQFPWPLI